MQVVALQSTQKRFNRRIWHPHARSGGKILADSLLRILLNAGPESTESLAVHHFRNGARLRRRFIRSPCPALGHGHDLCVRRKPAGTGWRRSARRSSGCRPVKAARSLKRAAVAIALIEIGQGAGRGGVPADKTNQPAARPWRPVGVAGRPLRRGRDGCASRAA